jgi:hypothetical protein
LLAFRLPTMKSLIPTGEKDSTAGMRGA